MAVRYGYDNTGALATVTKDGVTRTITYDADGMRMNRTNGTNTYSYIYNGGSLSQMTVDGTVMNFAYDASGTPMALTYGGATYYYATNIQGDVVAILNASGTAVVTYTYDAWGNILTTTGTLASTLGVHNPLRYRGYVYDPETGLYYLQSRYYDPQMGRFISPDALVSTGQGILGNNMFAYCLNNPVNMYDASGNLPEWIRDKLRWIEDNVISPIEDFVADVAEDIYNYDESNSDTNKVYKSHYFSSYNGTLVLRHSNSFLTSWAAFGVIVLNHSNDQSSSRDMTLKHEYGHILQEKELGSFKYGLQVFIPSATYNLLARNNKLLHTYYYSMPWECDADIRGGVVRKRAYWAEAVSVMYFTLWEG